MSNSAETMLAPRSALTNTFTNVNAREIDFVSRFTRNWDALREVMGIMRPIKKEAGTKLVSYTASVELEDGDVPEGAIIPYSKATVVEAAKGDLTLLKYAKAVTVEDVNKYGAKIAVQKTDNAFLEELQDKVMGDFYTFLTDDTYATTFTETTFQMAVALSIGKVKDIFKQMHKTSTNIVLFVNTIDAYQYLGAAEITVQNIYGLDYVKNFLGAQTVILSSEIDRGTVIATPAENIDLYYIDPSNSDFAQLGLNYTVDGETNLIGFHANGNYTTAVGESFALMGMALWAEYANGIVIATVDPTYTPDGEEG